MARKEEYMKNHEREDVTNEFERRLRDCLKSIEGILGVEIAELPSTPELRAEGRLPDWLKIDDEQEIQIREGAGKMDVDRLDDRTLEQSGLDESATRVLQGGQPHKVKAEFNAALEQPGTGPIVFTASRHREINNEREIESACKILGVESGAVGKTEYEVTMQLIGRSGVFGEKTTGISEEAKGLVEEGEQGNLQLLGKINGREIFIYDVPRVYRNEDGKTKYDQLEREHLLIDIASKGGYSQVSLDTSRTYSLTCGLSAGRVSQITDGKVRGGMTAYGMERLADVKGEPAPRPPTIEQVIGEIRAVYDELNKKPQSEQVS